MKKAFDTIRTILVWVVVLFAVSMLVFTIFSVTTLNRNDRSLFGYKMFIVTSDSMQATDFSSGDLLFIKEVNPATLKPGDIITFVSQDSNSRGETLTHKIRVKATDLKGNPGFITYGTTTNTDDENIVLYDDVLGKYAFHIAGLGRILNFLRSPAGFFFCIFLPISLVIVFELVNFFKLLRKSKEEEEQEEQPQKETVAVEQSQYDQLLAELQILKAQVADIKRAVTKPQPVKVYRKTTTVQVVRSRPGVKKKPVSGNHRPQTKQLQKLTK